jgi:hypothetical protein
MNKYAAEKIASEYYNMGMQLALRNAGLTKTAAPSAKQLAALLGGGLGGHTLALNANQLPKFLGGDTAMAKAIADYAARGEKGIMSAAETLSPSNLRTMLEDLGGHVEPAGMQILG